MLETIVINLMSNGSVLVEDRKLVLDVIDEVDANFGFACMVQPHVGGYMVSVSEDNLHAKKCADQFLEMITR